MSPVRDHSAWIRRGTAALVAALPLIVLAASSIAALQPKVKNPHGKFKDECGLCHSAQGWKPAHISSEFDHSKYGFRLEGAHKTNDCMSCHTSLEFAQAKTQCQSCHQDPHRGEMGADCARCHGARSFTDRSSMVRQHQLSRFPLTGSHGSLACESCHKPAAQGRMQFVGARADCKGCHMDAYNATTSPNHAAGGFPTECQQCHSTLTWSTAKFDHDRSGFPLTGLHKTTACASCHPGGRYAGTPRDCQSCHQTQYDTATPNHPSAGFAASQCATCHTTTTWSGATFDHNATAFPLTGSHRNAACAGCHSGGVYHGLATDCFSCHQTDYNSATPNHASAGFAASACATCHNTTAWAGATFDHNATAFPLTGSHRSAACSSCHASGVYHGLNRDCYSCHQSDYNNATPNHPSAGFAASACATCHNTTAWAGATFDHNATAFPLTGSHRNAACNSCHASGVYHGLNRDCYSCHQTDYNNATPNHPSAGFAASACATCHNTTAWAGATFDHNATAFPLSGAHRSAACTSCHLNGVYHGTPTDCYSCHRTDYDTAPLNHVAAGFAPTACVTCHNTTTWTNGTFNHSTTSFPLTGAHTSAACLSCHSNGVFNGHSADCYSCHRTEYDSATPNHAAAGFSQAACATCHTTTTWAGATFDHDSQYFRIYSGRHRGTWSDCATCHTNSTNYSVFTCLSCHPHDNRTETDGHHRGMSGYSYTSSACYSCHRRV